MSDNNDFGAARSFRFFTVEEYTLMDYDKYCVVDQLDTVLSCTKKIFKNLFIEY